MTSTQSPPIVSLQDPKDVSLLHIEGELSEIWQSYGEGEDGPGATRAATFSFIVYEPEETQPLLAALGFYSGPVDGISGPRTTVAIKAAQKAYGLEPTGVSNDELLAKLRSEFTTAKEKGELGKGDTQAARHFSQDLEGASIADAIAASNPCRIVTLCPTVGEDEGVSAQVSAYCPVSKKSNSATLVCCEYITLRGTSHALERIGGVISELMIAELPKFIWWKASPETEYGLFQRLVGDCERLIIDSSTFNKPESDLLVIGELLEKNTPIADLNWGRLAAWQELTAETFDPPERRNAISEIDRLTIDYEMGNPAQALMFVSWVASRLGWTPVSFTHEGGDYDIRRIKFTRADKREIEAELAGIPLDDWGEIAGDLIALKLHSTNEKADCCSVLCSEGTGCMRMETQGGAQKCYIQQVTPLYDQKTDQLLGQQLQRWGKEVLYEQGMEVLYEILKLAPKLDD